jgi:hypothetical protein
MQALLHSHRLDCKNVHMACVHESWVTNYMRDTAAAVLRALICTRSVACILWINVAHVHCLRTRSSSPSGTAGYSHDRFATIKSPDN